MTQRILIMGLPGSGKTTLAGALKRYLEENGEISYSQAEMLPLDTKCQVSWYCLNRDNDQSRIILATRTSLD